MPEPNVIEGTLLWEPTEASVAESGVGRYLAWLRTQMNLEFADYASL